MVDIRRGLSDEFINEFNNEYCKSSWLYELVNDKEIFTAIRNESISFYSCGCSIIKLNFNRRHKCLTGVTHYKYLLKPKIEGDHYIKFNNDGGVKDPDVLPNLLVKDLHDIKTLKEAVKHFASEEKVQSYKIIKNNPNIIDTEIALGKGSFIDLAAIKEGNEGAEITIYEVKLFGNQALRMQNTEKGIINQMRKYTKRINENRDLLTKSYRKVCENIVALNGVKDSGQYSSNVMHLIERIDKNELKLSIRYEPWLIVTQFDRDQQTGEVWKPHKERLKKEFDKRLMLVGDGSNVRLK